MPYLKGDTQEDPRHEFLYWTDDGELAACVTTAGSRCSWSSPLTALPFGRRPSFLCACPSCSTCMPTLSSGRR